MTFYVPSGFFGDFQIGRKIVFELDVLTSLYQSYCEEFIKPIVVIQVSICEAIIYDLLIVKTKYRCEGIPGIEKNHLHELEKSIKRGSDQYGKLLDKAKGTKNIYTILKEEDYEKAHRVRKARNLIHLYLNYDDNRNIDIARVFDKILLEDSEMFVERLLKASQKHLRPKHLQGMVNSGKLRVPWNPHLEWGNSR